MPLPISHKQEHLANLQAFLARWPLEKVRNLRLDEYTKARTSKADTSFRDSFCYGLEHSTPVGIGGASAIKFEIYARANLDEDPGDRKTLWDANYCWKEHLGKTSAEAFEKVRALLVDVVEAASLGDYERVERNELARTLKWKIAFLYQNPAKPGIIGWVRESDLREYFHDEEETMVGLHARAIEEFKDAPSLQEIGMMIGNATKQAPDEPKVDESEPNRPYGGGRGYWNFSYGQSDAEGINDYDTLLRTGEIRADWPTSESLANLSSDKELGKADAMELLDGDEVDDDTKETGRRPLFNFFHMGIPKGAILSYAADPTKTVEVIDERKVRFEGEETSMTDVTQRLRGSNYYVGPMPHWTFKGEKLSVFYNRTYPTRRPTGTALMCWLFAKKMKVGDVIFARQAKTQDYIAGIVTSDYLYDGSRETYQHYRKVKWLTTTKVDVPRAADIITKALTDISYGGWLSYVAEFFAKLGIDPATLPPVPAAMPAKDPSMIKPTNVILYGPPGTGKTYRTRGHAIKTCLNLPEDTEEAQAKDQFSKLIEGKRVAFVTFHQSYDYSDFIIGFKPVTRGNGAMGFEVRKGLLMRIAEEAANNPTESYLLIIDEINRGNVSKIFGELITLIEADKRAGGDFEVEVTLPCAYVGADGKETNQFTLPSNLHFLGTMNTADRSIALLDTALRRRFEFKNTPPDPSKLSADLGGVNLQNLLTNLNKTLKDKFDADHQVGHAWFPLDGKKGATIEKVIEAFNNKILPLLDEWFYDDEKGKLELVSQFTEGGKVTQKSLEKYSAKLA